MQAGEGTESVAESSSDQHQSPLIGRASSVASEVAEGVARAFLKLAIGAFQSSCCAGCPSGA